MNNALRILGITLLVMLLGWAAWEAQRTIPPIPEPAAIELSSTPIETKPAINFPPLSDYRATLDRPLFSPDRRHADSVASADAISTNITQNTTTLAPTRLSLSAIIVEGDKRSALLLAPGQAASTVVREGQDIGDWRLISVQEDSVTLEYQGQREQIYLRNFDNSPPALPPTARVIRRDTGTKRLRSPE